MAGDEPYSTENSTRRMAGFGARFAPEWVERQVGGAWEASLGP
jgi:hypothetical protein